jgi:hypothetical protein
MLDMKTEIESLMLNRRSVGQFVLGTIASLALPVLSTAEEAKAVEEVCFLPENDYPYFGYEPESHS